MAPSGFQHRDCNLAHIIHNRATDPYYYDTIQILITVQTGGNFSFSVFEGIIIFSKVTEKSGTHLDWEVPFLKTHKMPRTFTTKPKATDYSSSWPHQNKKTIELPRGSVLVFDGLCHHEIRQEKGKSPPFPSPSRGSISDVERKWRRYKSCSISKLWHCTT